MRTALAAAATDDLAERIAATAAEHAAAYPGDRQGRQPVHTVYVPADRFGAATVADLGAQARRLLDAHAPTPDALAAATGVPAALAAPVRARVGSKLDTEPVEDLRIDFEDGYGTRDDGTEDADAQRAAGAVAQMLRDGVTPPFVGLRIRSFAEGGHQRAIRTLDGFISTLLDAAGRLPPGFVITFPKVVAADHVAHFVTLLERLEAALGLTDRALAFEVQIETTQSIFDRTGRVALPAIVDAAGGRMTGAHFGVFDYTAACGLPGAQQRLDHPACDFARHVMQVSLAGTGVRLSDGSTNRVPRDDSTAAVSAVWRHHAEQVRRCLAHGFFQGWDMHPSHLVSRFAAVFAFHLRHIDDTTRRLAAWASATSADGGVLDEPATVRALLATLRRAIDCGAVDEDNALRAAGLAGADLRGNAPH
jgi:citrate lyase beta subunit